MGLRQGVEPYGMAFNGSKEANAPLDLTVIEHHAGGGNLYGGATRLPIEKEFCSLFSGALQCLGKGQWLRSIPALLDEDARLRACGAMGMDWSAGWRSHPA